MQKLMSNKKLIICICAVMVMIAAAVAIFLPSKEESYRSILVYEVEGTATIDRAGVGNMNAAENLYLESGDRVSVAQDSGMRMKLDDDKYVMAEADTVFSVEAQGTNENSKTKINLEQGAITNEIQHPLGEGASYETSTPNSVMAVRGTIYRVELYIDDFGEQNTKMCCFQGKVATAPVLPDGTQGEEVLVPAGSELIIHSDGTADDVRDIVYEELPEQAIQNLVSMLESGQTMEGVTLEELNDLMDQTADVSGESQNSEPEQTVPADAEEDSEQDGAVAEENTADTAKSVSAQTDKGVKEPAATQAPADAPEQETQISDVAQPKVSEPASNAASGGDNAGGDDSQSGDYSDTSGNGNESDNNAEGIDIPKIDIPIPTPTPPIPTPVPVVNYTVTFEYDGKTFATQTVKSGEKVSEPLLAPAFNGKWDFDFGTAIKANTTIKWKQ